MDNYKKFAPVVLRYGLVFVFLWFGINQILDQSKWVALIPDLVVNLTGLRVETIVLANGIAEVILATVLLIGFQVRIVSFLLFLHLGSIAFILGLTPSGVRDIGLIAGLFSVFLNGPDIYCYEKPKNNLVQGYPVQS